MASAKQIDANRRNAQSSTGPRTTEGKARSRCNAMKHGLSVGNGALHMPLAHENPEIFQEIRANLVNDYTPANTSELLLIDTIASAFLRVQRASRWEAAHIDGQIRGLKQRHGKPLATTPEDDLPLVICIGHKKNERAWAMLAKYEQRAHSDYFRAIEALRKVQKERFDREAKDLRDQIAREAYMKRTTTRVSPAPAAEMASFRKNVQSIEEAQKQNVPQPQSQPNMLSKRARKRLAQANRTTASNKPAAKS